MSNDTELPLYNPNTEPPLYNPNTQSYEVGPPGAFAPPSYTPIQMQENTGVITVQPSESETVHFQNRNPGDHFLILSAVLSIICFFVGSWCALCCTIPAIFYAVNARDAEVRGDRESMMKNHQIACCLNFVGFSVGLIILILSVFLFVTEILNGDPNEKPTDNY